MDKVLMDLFLRGLEDGMDKSANIYANVRGAGRALRSAKRLRAVRAARKAAKTATVGPKAIPKRAPVSSHVSHSVTNMPGKGSAAAQQVQANYAHVNPAAGAGFRATPVSNPTSMLAGRQQAAAAGHVQGQHKPGCRPGRPSRRVTGRLGCLSGSVRPVSTPTSTPRRQVWALVGPSSPAPQ